MGEDIEFLILMAVPIIPAILIVDSPRAALAGPQPPLRIKRNRAPECPDMPTIP